MSAWSTALEMLPAATASLLASISRSTSSGPIRAIAAIQARATPAAATPKRLRRAPAPVSGGAICAQRAAASAPAARKKTAPSPAISQNQSKPAPTAKTSIAAKSAA